MPAKTLLLLCSLWGSLGACSLNPPPPPIDSGRYTLADGGRTVQHLVGDELELRLPPPQTPGASWGRPKLSGGLLFYLGPTLGGTSGDTVLRFRVDAPGVAVVRVSEGSLPLGPVLVDGEEGETEGLRSLRLTVVSREP